MVAKINSGASLFGALSYNINKVKEGQARVILSEGIIQNLSGNKDLDLFLAMKSFEPYLCLNDRIKKPVVHISLNPDLQDNLTDEQYAILAKEYLEKMGFSGQPFLVYKHEDIDRHHIHIVTIRVNGKGEKISDQYEHFRSMKVCRELEEKHNLHPAIKSKNEFSQSQLQKVDYGKGDLKRQIGNTVKSAMDLYRFHSFGEFNALLSLYNIQAKLVKGERFGETYKGIVYSVTDDKGTVVSPPFKASLFGKRMGFLGLEKVMKRNTESLKKSDYRNQLKPVISDAIRFATSKDDFINRLKDRNIDVIFRENEAGRIYGVTYIDHQSNMVINGSRLGKEFSANLLDYLFNKENHPSTVSQASEQTSSLFGQAFGLFGFTPHSGGEDLEAKKFENELKRRKRKKKRKKGRYL